MSGVGGYRLKFGSRLGEQLRSTIQTKLEVQQYRCRSN